MHTAPTDHSAFPLRLFVAESAGPGDPPSSSFITLYQAWQRHHRPRLEAAGRSPATIVEIDRSLRYWQELTGDPPLDAIDDDTLNRFAAALWKLPGRKTPTIGSYSVIKHVTNVNAVLRTCGPRSVANRRGRGLLADPPLLERPARPHEPPADDFTTAEVRQLIAAADAMDKPAAANWEPGLFWRAVLLTFAYAGFRRKTLFALDASNLVDGFFLVRPEQIKQQKGFKQFCHPLALAAIEALGITPGGPLFAWPQYRTKEGARGWFNEHFNRLVIAAGIPEGRRFGTKGLRKWHASEMAAINPLAAQLSLNHSTGGGVIGRHYVNHRIVRDTMLKLPKLIDEPTGDDARQGRLF